MKTLKQLIAGKQFPLAIVSPNDSVYHALSVLATHDVGALLVMDGEELVGMFSERDYARKIELQGRTSKDTKVRDVMSDRVVYVTPEHTPEQCMALMTEKHFRHLPVVANDHVIGIVSIGDLVKEIISDQQFIIAELERYISG